MKTPSFQVTKSLLTILAPALFCGAVQAQILTPLSVTGFNRDIVVATSESGPPFTTLAFDSTGGGNSTWFELGRNGSDPTSGLPTTAFTSASDPNITIQFASFTANNALYLRNASPSNIGTLTLAAPTTISSLAVIGASAAGAGSNAVVLNLLGGGTLSLGAATNSGQDWFNGTSGLALQVGGRINLTDGVMTDLGTNPRIYQDVFTFSAVTVESVTFTFSAASNNTRNAIMGLSATVVPEPTSLVLGLAGAGMLAFGRRRVIRA